MTGVTRRTALYIPEHGCRFLRVVAASTCLRAALIGSPLLMATAQRAESQVLNAQVQGTITSGETGKALPGATITVQGPALPALQAEIADSNGHFVITQLPPGDDYTVSFYYGAAEQPFLTRSGLRLSAGKTVTVDARLGKGREKREVQVIKESAPNVDVANANTGLELNQDVLQSSPLRGRSFQGALFLAPGAADVTPRNFNGSNGSLVYGGTDAGVSLGGATGSENAYLIDGVNTTDPSLGVVAAEVSQYFLKELTILTGGYQAEYGRATGGIVSMVTKSGSNELHGGVYGSLVPYQIEGTRVARIGEAIQIRERPDMGTWDLGFDIGGAIVKDRLWFYAGFVTTSVTNTIERRGRRLIFDGAGARPLADFSCPDYLADGRLCDGARLLAYDTEELSYSQIIKQSRTTYNAIAKLQLHISENHDLFLSYIGSPNSLDSVVDAGYADLASKSFFEVNQIHDLSLRYQGKTLGKRLQFDVMYAMHFQSQTQRPADTNQEQYWYLADPIDPYSLSDFEPVADCQRQTTTAGTFNPCPVTLYSVGLGVFREQQLQRHQALASATLYLHLLGVHALKAGFDFEYVRNQSGQAFVGPLDRNARFDTTADGSDLALSLAFGSHQDGQDRILDRFTGTTQARKYAAYLRDSWSVGSTGLVINAGVRWEGTQVLDVEGKTALSLLENVAPRVGAVWDFTRLTRRPGRGKLFVNYARFFESLPLDIGERAFAGQALLVRLATMSATGCPQVPRQPGGRALPVYGPSCNFDTTFLAGGTPYEIPAGTRPNTVDEAIAGLTIDVGYDFVLGASYTYRNLTYALEDFSLSPGGIFFLGNPGVEPSAEALAAAASDAMQKQAAAAQPNATQADVDAAAAAQAKLDGYTSLTLLPRPRREYHAFTLTANKRLSRRFSLLASYTYSRSMGNYSPGVVNGTGQMNPHTSTQYDLPELMLNRDGPLGTDRPHNFKLSGYYLQPVGSRGQFTAGLTFSAISGRPIEVLGAHPSAGAGEVYILPRGSGGRTPTVTQFDLRVGYDHRLTPREQFGIYVDAINLFNQRAVTNVDEFYTSSSVLPLTDQAEQKALAVRTVDGSPAVLNSNYGQPTAYQAPLYLRVGARLMF